MNPIIGIVEWPYFDKDSDQVFAVPTAISNKIIKHGGIPLGIFPSIEADFAKKEITEFDESSKNDLFRILSKCDAIIKPGALRIYNYERLIYDYAVSYDMPFLGICAGMQLMAHYRKERIQNNVRNDSIINHNVRDTYAHKIIINENSKLFKILNKKEILVNSYHNFHIKDSNSFNVSAVSEDGYIEGLENPNATFQLGVQWHPEKIDDENSDLLFDYFIEEAKKYTK